MPAVQTPSPKQIKGEQPVTPLCKASSPTQRCRPAPTNTSDISSQSCSVTPERKVQTSMLLLLCCLSLALGAVSPSADPAEVKLERGSCPMFWFSFNGHCYKYMASSLTWADAELYCVSQGANLGSIHSGLNPPALNMPSPPACLMPRWLSF